MTFGAPVKISLFSIRKHNFESDLKQTPIYA